MAKEKTELKKIWKICTFAIEESSHCGIYSIRVPADDIFEAGEKGRKEFTKQAYTDHERLEIQSIRYIGEFDA